jgi:thymidylate synthase
MVTLSAQARAFHVDQLRESVRSPVRVNVNTHSSGRRLIVGLFDVAPMTNHSLLPNMWAHQWATPYELGVFSRYSEYGSRPEPTST